MLTSKSESIRRTVLQVHAISVVSANTTPREEQQGGFGNLAFQFERLQSGTFGDLDDRRIERPVDSSVLPNDGPAVEAPLSIDAREQNRDFTNNCQPWFGLTKPGTIRVDATINLQRCPRLCRCKCHVSHYVRTPRWLSTVIGQLMFDYTSLIYAKPCDYPPCKKSPRKRQLTYLFPGWLATRALFMSYVVDSISGSGASWALKVPIVVPSNNPIWTAAVHGNIEFVRNRLTDGRATSYIVSENGWNLLHVSIHQSYQALEHAKLCLNAWSTHETLSFAATAVAPDQLLIENIEYAVGHYL